MIDILNVSTYPKEIENFIMSKLSSMPKNIIDEIKSYRVVYNKDISCAIEDFLSFSKQELFYDNLMCMLENYEFIVYHATKVLNKDLIMKNGIRVNDWNRYSAMLTNTYKQLGISEINIAKALSLIEYEYNRKFDFGERGKELCFFSGLNLIDTKDIAGYEQFCENIGGEIARHALEEKCFELYRPLQENGEAYIVKFKLPFKNIISLYKKGIAYSFVCFFAAIKFFDYAYEIKFDGKTLEDVSAANILEIIPYV